MLAIDADISEVLQPLDELAAAIDRRQPQIIGGVGSLVRDFAVRDFATKAAGGRGDDGVTWRPHAASTIRRRGVRPIGGSIGEQQNIVAEPVDGQVAIRCRHRAANMFNKSRPLLPSRLPDRWYRAANRFIQSDVDQVAKELLQ